MNQASKTYPSNPAPRPQAGSGTDSLDMPREARPREIPLHVGGLREMNEMLWGKILELEERLTPVLRHPDAVPKTLTEDNNSAALTAVVTTELSKALEQEVRNMWNTMERVKAITYRLEL